MSSGGAPHSESIAGTAGAILEEVRDLSRSLSGLGCPHRVCDRYQRTYVEKPRAMITPNIHPRFNTDQLRGFSGSWGPSQSTSSGAISASSTSAADLALSLATADSFDSTTGCWCRLSVCGPYRPYLSCHIVMAEGSYLLLLRVVGHNEVD